jgi:hypothetical protein
MLRCFRESAFITVFSGEHCGMPGNSRNSVYYDFPNGTPWPVKVMVALLFANFAGSFAVTLWAEQYAQRQPTITRSFPIHFKGGVVVFVQPWLGLYEHWSFWLQFVFLGLMGVMFWVYAQKGQAVRSR